MNCKWPKHPRLAGERLNNSSALCLTLAAEARAGHSSAASKEMLSAQSSEMTLEGDHEF